MWFLCKKAVLNNLRKGVILIVQNVKNIQNIFSRKRWCHVGCLPLKENTVAGFPPFGIWRFFNQMLKDISPHWGFEQILFSHRSTCTFFFQKKQEYFPQSFSCWQDFSQPCLVDLAAVSPRGAAGTRSGSGKPDEANQRVTKTRLLSSTNTQPVADQKCKNKQGRNLIERSVKGLGGQGRLFIAALWACSGSVSILWRPDALEASHQSHPR